MLLYLPTRTELRRQPTALYTIKKTIAGELGIPFVDLTPHLRGSVHDLFLEGDPVHLNGEGNRLIADAVAGAFQQMVSRQDGVGSFATAATAASR